MLHEFNKFGRLDRSPDILVLHAGGNDFVKRLFRELIRDIKFYILMLWALFPGLITVGPAIVPRSFWRGARIKVNRAIGCFMARNGAVVVRHRELESGTEGFWRSDGAYMNAVGTDLWNLALQDGTETAVRMWWGRAALRGSARAWWRKGPRSRW